MNAGSIRRQLGPAAQLGAEVARRSRNEPLPDMEAVRASAAVSRPQRVVLSAPQRERFHALYRDHFDFVFRNLRRLGVPSASIDDALQEVYVVVLRRIGDFSEGSSPRAWLFAITLRVAGNFRRTHRRRGEVVPLVEPSFEASAPSPFDEVARAEAGRVLHGFLDTLGDAKRGVFVMAELEHMTAPEIAQALSLNVNTVYSRLQAARAEFARMVSALGRKDGRAQGAGRSHE